MNLIRKMVNSYSEEDAQFHYELKKLLNFSPRKINKYKKAFTRGNYRSRVSKDDLQGPKVWELEGPTPILSISKTLINCDIRKK